jgi:hypothetical protein
MGKAKTINSGIFNKRIFKAKVKGKPDSVIRRTKSNKVPIATPKEVNKPIPNKKGNNNSTKI